MERLQEKGGVPAIVAVLAILIVLYSLWGASVLRQQASSGTPAETVATNS